MVGEVEVSDDGVLVVRRIHAAYTLRADPSAKETVDRVLGFHARRCPMARSLEGAVAVTTSVTIVPEAG